MHPQFSAKVFVCMCTDIDLAQNGHVGLIWLLVHVGDKVDLKIFNTIVGGNEASVMKG